MQKWTIGALVAMVLGMTAIFAFAPELNNRDAYILAIIASAVTAIPSLTASLKSEKAASNSEEAVHKVEQIQHDLTNGTLTRVVEKAMMNVANGDERKKR